MDYTSLLCYFSRSIIHSLRSFIMKYLNKLLPIVSILSITSFSTRTNPDENVWKPLLDKNLSQWEMYLSYRHKVGFKGEAPTDSIGNVIPPIGYNRNVDNVFTAYEEDGKTVLKVSGEIYGCVFTKQEFENYHLKLQVKWGTKKWIPRLDEPMDAGILYHSQGPCGVDYWKSWMLSQEFQIIEGGMGDYWNIASSQINIKSLDSDRGNGYKYSKDGRTRAFGTASGMVNYCQAGQVVEHPKGEWNTLELLCFQDKSIYIVNGVVVMALSHSRFVDSNNRIKPLRKGKLQLQSEAAEVFYKDVQIKCLKSMPKKYQSFF